MICLLVFDITSDADAKEIRRWRRRAIKQGVRRLKSVSYRRRYGKPRQLRELLRNSAQVKAIMRKSEGTMNLNLMFSTRV
jgi:hypothetical protein